MTTNTPTTSHKFNAPGLLWALTLVAAIACDGTSPKPHPQHTIANPNQASKTGNPNPQRPHKAHITQPKGQRGHLLAFKDPSSHFVTTWEGHQVTIPAGEGVFTYDVDWNNDLVFDQMDLKSSVTHTFDTRGPHTIRIRGRFPHMNAHYSDQGTLLSVDQWGNIRWTSMASMFWYRDKMILKAKDAPDLSQVTDMSSMFKGAAAFNGSIGHWDTSHITNMSHAFSYAAAFNQDLSGWNTGGVTNMAHMFKHAVAFNGSIGTWNTSNVADTSYMFDHATAFNQPIGTWDTSGVITMRKMFQNATAFNQDISAWDTTKVQSMRGMFNGAVSFNQNVSKWPVHSVKAPQRFDKPRAMRPDFMPLWPQ